MKVYICYNLYDNFCGIFSSVAGIFAEEVDALLWVEEFEPTENEWREYQEWVVQ